MKCSKEGPVISNTWHVLGLNIADHMTPMQSGLGWMRDCCINQYNVQTQHSSHQSLMMETETVFEMSDAISAMT